MELDLVENGLGPGEGLWMQGKPPNLQRPIWPKLVLQRLIEGPLPHITKLTDFPKICLRNILFMFNVHFSNGTPSSVSRTIQ